MLESGFIPIQELVFWQGLIPWLEQVRPAQPLPATPPFPGNIVVPPALAVPRTLDNPFPKDRDVGKSGKTSRNIVRDLMMKGSLAREITRNTADITSNVCAVRFPSDAEEIL